MSLDEQRTNGQSHAGSLPEIDPSEYGPAMLALSDDRRRQFVINTFRFATYTEAYCATPGYNATADNSAKNSASRLASDPKVQAAIHELGRLHYGGLAPLAVRQTKAVLEDKSHKEFGKTLRMVCGYLWPAQQEIAVTHHHEGAEGEALAIRLLIEMRQNGTSRSALLELFGRALLEKAEGHRQRLIEGSAVEINTEQPEQQE